MADKLMLPMGEKVSNSVGAHSVDASGEGGLVVFVVVVVVLEEISALPSQQAKNNSLLMQAGSHKNFMTKVSGGESCSTVISRSDTWRGMSAVLLSACVETSNILSNNNLQESNI